MGGAQVAQLSWPEAEEELGRAYPFGMAITPSAVTKESGEVSRRLCMCVGGPEGEPALEVAGDEVGVAVAVAPRPQVREKVEQLPPYNVVLLNDDDHSFEYVIEMLLRLFGISPPAGFKMAEMVHLHGRVKVVTAHKELAELRRDQIHAFGKDRAIAACKGSMSAIIEPAFGGDDVPPGSGANGSGKDAG